MVWEHSNHLCQALIVLHCGCFLIYMFSLLKFGGIGLLTCKMTLYIFYMQSVEPNATKLFGIYESTRFWQRSLTVGCGERFTSKKHVLLLNLEERKIRQLRRPPPLFRQKLRINLTETRMKSFFRPNEGKNKEKLWNTENSKIMKLAWKFQHFQFPCLQETEKTSEIYDKSFDFIERLKELISWSGLRSWKTRTLMKAKKPIYFAAATSKTCT